MRERIQGSENSVERRRLPINKVRENIEFVDSRGLSELRELLGATPSIEHFEQILDWFLVRSSTHEASIGLDYAKEHLKIWPDETREVCGYHFLEDLPSNSLVRSLDFSHSDFEDIVALLNSPYTQITYLDLSYTFIGPQEAKVIAESPWIANLKSLDLSDCQIEYEGFKDLVRSPYIANLTSLNLNRCEFNEVISPACPTDPEDYLLGLELSSPNLSNLIELHVKDTPFGLYYGISSIAESRHFTNLRVLSLDPIDGYHRLYKLVALGFSKHLHSSIRKQYLLELTIEELLDEVHKRNISLAPESNKDELIETILNKTEYE